ncbi:hypothetical protein LguiB_026920 [Lonicera macranthoides]
MCMNCEYIRHLSKSFHASPSAGCLRYSVSSLLSPCHRISFAICLQLYRRCNLGANGKYRTVFRAIRLPPPVFSSSHLDSPQIGH